MAFLTDFTNESDNLPKGYRQTIVKLIDLKTENDMDKALEKMDLKFEAIEKQIQYLQWSMMALIAILGTGLLDKIFKIF